MLEIYPPELETLPLCVSDVMKTTQKTPESFSVAITHLINDAEQNGGGAFHIRELAKSYGIQRRRLYDVLLVLEVCGVCQKTSVDTIVWKGMNNVYDSVKMLWKKQDVTPISSRASITITQLTELFLISFFSLNQTTFNIRDLASKLASSANRQKTLLCKLHQIAFILDAAGIVQKTNYCYVTLSSHLTSINKPSQALPEPILSHTQTPSFLSIESLLNKH